MPSRFCDNEDPCPSLRKAAMMLLSRDWSEERYLTRLEDGSGKLVEAPMFQAIIMSKNDIPLRVFFEYCPFCGTRIDPTFLENLRAKASRG